MNEIDVDVDRTSEQIVLDDPVGEAVGFAEWLATHSSLPADCASDAPTPRVPARPRRWGGAAGAVLLAATVFTVATHQHPNAEQAHPVHSGVKVPVAQSAPTVVVSGNSAGCAHSSGDSEALAAVTGAGVLRVRDGAQAIAMFEAAYYRARSGLRARQMVAVSSAIPDVAGIQAGIDSVPVGTTYCARIQVLAAGLYGVEIHEARPGDPETVWRQQISTSSSDGYVLITAITQL